MLEVITSKRLSKSNRMMLALSLSDVESFRITEALDYTDGLKNATE